MPLICPVCTKGLFSSQNRLECTHCNKWVHHGNRLHCSALTDEEFQDHVVDNLKPFECDHCISERVSKENNSYFMRLPFPVECEGNIFGKPYIKTSKPDITTLSPSQLKKFVEECQVINEHLNSDDEEDELLTTSVNSKYHDIKSLNALKPDKKSSLGIIHVNIASLNAHIDDLRTVLSRLKFDFDVIGISEHKIREDCPPSNNIDIPGYNEFIFQPTSTSHGGTGFYIKNNLDYIERHDLTLNSPSNFEASFVEIVLPNRKNLIVGCIYRHGASSLPIRDFTENHLQPLLFKISKEKKECAIMGDFNIDLLKMSNAASDFNDNMSSHFFTPFILQPTRLRSKTLIDNIFVNSLEYHSYSGNLLYELSDHLMQFVIFEGFVKERSLPSRKIFKRGTINEREYEEMVINALNWDEICMLRYGDASASFKSFYDTHIFHLDEMAPLQEVTLKEFRLMTKPWITKEILKKCDERDRLLKQVKSEIDPVKRQTLHDEFKNLRNEITTEKREGKRNHNISLFERNKNKSSDTWKCIRSLVNIKPAKSSSIKLLDENGNLISDPSLISNIFNDHFSTLGTKVQNKIPIVNGSHRDYMKKREINPDGSLGKCLINPNGCSFFLTATGPDEIQKLIDKLDSSKSTGPFGLPIFLLKRFKEYFSIWLSELINLSFETGEFPTILKLAKVTPIHKKESKLDHLNYRPISLLSVFSKIYEKCIYNRIYHYLDQNKLIFSKQFGFRAGYSCNHAIISLTEYIRKKLDDTEYVCGVFVDLEKAFDTVHHDILCDKLLDYGLRGNINNLVKSYLSGRKQVVSINGFESSSKDVTCGVPQGSSLGPLLFLIYINDFRLCLGETSCGHFADDTFIIYSSKKPKTIETVINHELKAVVKWLRLNKLSLNAGKTELIFFRSNRHPLDYSKISIKLNGLKLKPVDFIKYLGMLIDNHLNWNHHIDELCKKLSRANGILSKLRYDAPIKILTQVYYSIFHSHLINGCNLWSLTPRDENIQRIERLQKKCLRIMTFAPFGAPTHQIFQNLELIKVRDIIRIEHLKLVRGFQDESLPDDLMDMFELSKKHSTSMVLNSEVYNHLFIPQFNTITYGKKSLKYHCAKLWNETFKRTNTIQISDNQNDNIKLSEIESNKRFKYVLKRHFLYKYSLNNPNNSNNQYNNNSNNLPNNSNRNNRFLRNGNGQGQRFQSRWDLEIGESTNLI